MDFVNFSKNTSEKNKISYMSLKFFIANSRDRVQRVKSGCRLVHVIESQAQENKHVIHIYINSL